LLYRAKSKSTTASSEDVSLPFDDKSAEVSDTLRALKESFFRLRKSVMDRALTDKRQRRKSLYIKAEECL